MEMIQENEIQMIDFKMVDINGQFRHVTIPASQFSEETLKAGIGFDASNYGYAVAEKSDMVFILALDVLEADHDYLTTGGVFSEHLIKNFIANKRKECSEMSKIPHPAEFDRYFNL